MSNRSTQMMEEQEQQVSRRQREMVTFEITLSPRYKVRLRETNGFDEEMVLKMLGDKFKMSGAGAMMYRNAMIARSIHSYLQVTEKPKNPDLALEDQPLEESAPVEQWRMMAPKDAGAFLSGLSSKEKSMLEAAYSEVNEISDEERAAVKNAVTPTIES